MPSYEGVSTRRLFKLTPTLTPASVGAATVAEQTFTVTGVQLGDVVALNHPSITAGVGPISVRVSALNQIAIAFVNPTAGALTPAAGVYSLSVTRID